MPPKRGRGRGRQQDPDFDELENLNVNLASLTEAAVELPQREFQIPDFRSSSQRLHLMDSVEEFSGESDVTVGDFFDQIDLLGNHAGWSDQDKLLVAKLRVKGRAKGFITSNLSLKRETSYDVFRTQLLDNFEIRISSHTSLKQLLLAYQRPTESVRNFASRLEALSHRTVTNELRDNEAVNGVRQENLLQAFLAGLKPDIQRAVVIQNHKTFAKAKTHASLQEELQEQMQTVNNTVRASSGVDTQSEITSALQAQAQVISDLSAQMQQLSAELGQLRQQRGSSRPKGEIRCYQCNEIGHFRRDCRSGPRQNPRNQFNSQNFPPQAGMFGPPAPHFQYPPQGPPPFPYFPGHPQGGQNNNRPPLN